MVEQTHVLLDLRVTGVVPVAAVLRFGQQLDQRRVVGVERQFLKFFAVLEAQPDALLLRVGQQVHEALPGVLPVGRQAPPQSGERFHEHLLVIGIRGQVSLRVRLEVALHRARRVEPEELGRAEVQDDLLRLHLVGKIDGALALAQPLVALPGVERGRHVEVGCGVHDAGRQGAEIVARSDLDDAVLNGLQDAGHEDDLDAVAQLHPFETKARHLLEHLVAVGVAM